MQAPATAPPGPGDRGDEAGPDRRGPSRFGRLRGARCGSLRGSLCGSLCCSIRAGAHLHFAAMSSVTDYALARRAVLRDFRRGTLTRLDVCDAHPELIRAAQFIGTDIDDECPVCGATNLRLVSYVYGEKLKQANGRAISNQAELRKLGAS